MASDEAYMDFLNKANGPPGGKENVGAQSHTASAGKKELKATDDASKIPASLKDVTNDAYYVSDSDEKFVPVSLAIKESEELPDEEEIATLVGHKDPSTAEVEIMDPVDWDKNGQYSKLVDAVRAAGKGNDVRVYRIAVDRSRAEYYVVTIGEGKRLVGVKALAIES